MPNPPNKSVPILSTTANALLPQFIETHRGKRPRDPIARGERNIDSHCAFSNKQVTDPQREALLELQDVASRAGVQHPQAGSNLRTLFSTLSFPASCSAAPRLCPIGSTVFTGHSQRETKENLFYKRFTNYSEEGRLSRRPLLLCILCNAVDPGPDPASEQDQSRSHQSAEVRRSGGRNDHFKIF